MPGYFDTHVHLASRDFARDIEAVLARAHAAGVEHMLAVGGDMSENRRVLTLAEQCAVVYAAVGVHPNALPDAPTGWRDELAAMLAAGGIHAVGETGLDLYRRRVPLEEQVKAFFFHLELAATYGLPVVIHQRAAADEMLRALREFSLTGGCVRGVMHCFSGEQRYLEGVLALDLYVSVAGTATYPRNRRLRELVGQAPESRLLIETDAPYLPPQPQRGRRNEPAFIGAVAATLADCLRVAPADVARITARNAQRLLNIGASGGSDQVVYSIRDSLYVNLTNQCSNRCQFCPRTHGNFEVRGYDLRLAAEPTAEEVISALEAALAEQPYREVVFCGFGEPTLRLDVLVEAAARFRGCFNTRSVGPRPSEDIGGKEAEAANSTEGVGDAGGRRQPMSAAGRSQDGALKQPLKGRVRLRLDTNGQVELYHGPAALPRLAAVLDAVSVSLNTSDPEQYVQLCRPEKGKAAYAAALRFVKYMRRAGLETIVTAVKMPGVDTQRFAALAAELGVHMKLRERLG